MKSVWINTLLSLVVGASFAASAHAELVECPQGLKWTFEGYCKKDINFMKESACPQRSKLGRASVTGPLICIAQGRCSADYVPNARGVCVEPEVKKRVIAKAN
jgi:hypothetical protein